MNYKIDPGVYALNEPGPESPVFVTANYKMSFDRLRAAVPERSAWILVLDTGGVNVWCAAGKGAFGTEELCRRVQGHGLDRLVTHGTLVLPQLSAPSVCAHEVKRRCGFRVAYGPVRAGDLDAFLSNGMKADPEMRRKTFDLWDRVVLIPVELVSAVKIGILAYAVLFLAGGLGGRPEGYGSTALASGGTTAWALAAAILAGAVLAPILLPYLPGRSFSVKGFAVGVVSALGLVALEWDRLNGVQGRLEMAGWVLVIPAAASYLAMNFTGASTFTSLSGVRKEVRRALPLQIAGGAVGLGLWFAARFLG